MNKIYSRINWENYPAQTTPINEANLNKIDYAVDENENRIISLDASKFDKASAGNLVADWSMDESTGLITITKVSGEQITFDLNVEKIPVSFSLTENGILVMITEDGTEFTADISAMIPVITFQNSDTVLVNVSEDENGKIYFFTIKDGSITSEKLQPDYLADITVQTEQSLFNATRAENAADRAEAAADKAESVSSIEVATTEKAGVVKPDGKTILITEDGTIYESDNTLRLSEETEAIDEQSSIGLIQTENKKIYPKTLIEAISDKNGKSLESRITSKIVGATLLAGNWTGEAAPYSYELAVDGVTESTNVEILPPAEMVQEQYDAITAACIVGGTQAEGSITLQAWGEVPMIDIPIRVLVRGD